VSDEAAAASAQRLPIGPDVDLRLPFDAETPPAAENNNDETLVERIKTERCPLAIEQLFDQYFRLVLSIALKILRDDGEAEDLMQEVFLEVFRKIDQYDPERGSLKVWIMQVAYNRSFDRRIYLQSRRFYEHQELSNNLALLKQKYVTSEVWRGLAPGEVELLLRRAMDKLSDRQRRTIELVYFRGMDLREVAKEMRETYRTARNNMFRGMRKLRAIVNEMMGQNGKDSADSR
jgi:RNA polymerase sigma-70 factor, ECF subfamily